MTSEQEKSQTTGQFVERFILHILQVIVVAIVAFMAKTTWDLSQTAIRTQATLEFLVSSFADFKTDSKSFASDKELQQLRGQNDNTHKILENRLQDHEGRIRTLEGKRG